LYPNYNGKNKHLFPKYWPLSKAQIINVLEDKLHIISLMKKEKFTPFTPDQRVALLKQKMSVLRTLMKNLKACFETIAEKNKMSSVTWYWTTVENFELHSSLLTSQNNTKPTIKVSSAKNYSTKNYLTYILNKD